MKNWYKGLGLILMVLALAGCASGAATPAPAVTGGDTYANITAVMVSVDSREHDFQLSPALELNGMITIDGA